MIDEIASKCVWDDFIVPEERVAKHSPLYETFPSDDPGVLEDLDVDVVIVGAGFTGLWTAHYLKVHEPELRVVVIESRHVGFGASGRNGGWSSAVLPMSFSSLAREHGPDVALSFDRAMIDSVDEVVSQAHRLGIGNTVAKGGYVQVARSEPQWERLREYVSQSRELGVSEVDLRLLDRESTAQMIDTTRCLGSVYTPNCAAIHPGALVRSLAVDLRQRGVRILEGVSALAIEPGVVMTDRGSLRTPVSVRATEAFTARLRGFRRRVLPLYSLMVATEPIDREVLDTLISPTRPTFNDARNLIVYGQRTFDDRIAFGGRGAPYHFGSRIEERFDTDPEVFRHLTSSLREMFPALGDVRITHHWGGPLGAPRDWTCSVNFDRKTGMASAGGYVGDGVTTSNLAGRTLADLITERSTNITGLPWVDHRSRSWEPEPLRWFAVNAMTALADLADRRELRTGRRAKVIERVMDSVLGD
ncbi:MAG: hypothetical protein RL726_2217 [Actinomycetota bacterium]|jgi:glycine/D-amino acid oxidase-like deaminating enzyme